MTTPLHPVSPKLVKVRYLVVLPWTLIAILGFLIPALLIDAWFYVGAAIFFLLFLWQLWLIPAQVKKLGWLESEQELLLTKGKLWHVFTVVPYGRIQFVDVKAGPIERAFGLKHVELHTASSTSDAKVRGLPGADADALRTRLAERARERMNGL
ncbi:PH domain-containing protein [Corynebacterium sp. H127]|uniref:PH domain-containing protein n=1 Tax=Corynebacterium sp. H127 TaxID=3133418 RepID=UPI0030A25EE6